MKTSLHTGEVSPPPAQAAGWGLKIGAEHGGGSEKQSFGVENSLDEPSDGRIIGKETSKTQFYAMNNRSNGKSRTKCEISNHRRMP
jgi:hypothetical protein